MSSSWFSQFEYIKGTPGQHILLKKMDLNVTFLQNSISLTSLCYFFTAL